MNEVENSREPHRWLTHCSRHVAGFPETEETETEVEVAVCFVDEVLRRDFVELYAWGDDDSGAAKASELAGYRAESGFSRDFV